MDLNGTLLIASPSLQDINFLKTVILILKHDKGGAAGLVLNRPVPLQTVPDLANLYQNYFAGHQEEFVYLGGPVPSGLVMLSGDKLNGFTKVIEDLYFADTFDVIREALNKSTHHKMFLGISSWIAGQLESELNLGGWLLLKQPKKLLFWEKDIDLIWKDCIDAVQLEFIKEVFKIPDRLIPKDVSLN